MVVGEVLEVLYLWSLHLTDYEKRHLSDLNVNYNLPRGLVKMKVQENLEEAKLHLNWLLGNTKSCRWKFYITQFPQPFSPKGTHGGLY